MSAFCMFLAGWWSKMDFCDGFSYLWSQISQHTSSYCHHHLCIIKEGFLPKQNILMGVEHCKCQYEMYDTTMRGRIYQRALWWWRQCGDDDCDDDGDCGDVGNEDDGGVDNTVTENVRARLRNRNLTNERKFLLNFESRQIPCDIFANSQVIFGHSFCQFFGSSVAQYLCEYHRLSAQMICTAVETFYKENYAKRLAELTI